MPTDDQIRNLCLRVTLSTDDEEFKARLSELQTAIREHMEGAANLGIHLILNARKATVTTKTKDGTND